MERLLADAEKLTGIHYDISNLDQVYSAIQVIQDELGITGTTAQEASETFTGSFAAMQSAAKNLLGNLALGEDIGPSLEALGDSIGTFLTGNLFPMVGNIFSALFSDSVLGAIPDMLQSAVELVANLARGLAENAETVIPAMVETILTIVDTLTDPDNLTSLVSAAAELIVAIATGLIKALPTLLERAPEIIGNLAMAIIQSLPVLGEAILEINDAFWDGIGELISSAFQWGSDLIQSFIDGIKAWIQNLVDTVKNVASTVADYLGFSEPDKGPLADFHTFAPDMMELFAQGIRDNEHLISDQIANSFDVGTQMVDYGVMGRTGAPAVESVSNQGMTGGSFPPIILDVTMMLDGAVLARQQYNYNNAEANLRGVPIVGG